jgi:hypothetical protein
MAGHFFGFVDVNLDEFNIRILSCQPLKDGANEFARSTPDMRCDRRE